MKIFVYMFVFSGEFLRLKFFVVVYELCVQIRIRELTLYVKSVFECGFLHIVIIMLVDMIGITCKINCLFAFFTFI